MSTAIVLLIKPFVLWRSCCSLHHGLLNSLLRHGRGGEEEKDNKTTPSRGTFKDRLGLRGSHVRIEILFNKHALTKMGKCLLKHGNPLNTLTFRKRKTIAKRC